MTFIKAAAGFVTRDWLTSAVVNTINRSGNTPNEHSAVNYLQIYLWEIPDQGGGHDSLHNVFALTSRRGAMLPSNAVYMCSKFRDQRYIKHKYTKITTEIKYMRRP